MAGYRRGCAGESEGRCGGEDGEDEQEDGEGGPGCEW